MNVSTTLDNSQWRRKSSIKQIFLGFGGSAHGALQKNQRSILSKDKVIALQWQFIML